MGGRAPELTSGHLPVPPPLYIGLWKLIGDCPKWVLIRLFSGTSKIFKVPIILKPCYRPKGGLGDHLLMIRVLEHPWGPHSGR